MALVGNHHDPIDTRTQQQLYCVWVFVRKLLASGCMKCSGSNLRHDLRCLCNRKLSNLCLLAHFNNDIFQLPSCADRPAQQNHRCYRHTVNNT